MVDAGSSSRPIGRVLNGYALAKERCRFRSPSVYWETGPFPSQVQIVGLRFGGHHFQNPARITYNSSMSVEPSHVAESPKGVDSRLVVAGVVVVAVVALLLLAGPFRSSDVGQAGGPGDSGGVTYEPPPPDSEEVTLAMAHAEARAIARGAVAEAEGKAEVVRSTLAECSGVIDEWAALRDALLDNEDGRRVAASDETTRRFLALFDSASPDAARIRLGAIEKRLESVQGPLDRMRSAESSVHAPKGLVDSLNELAADAGALTEQVRSQLRGLQALVSSTRSSEPADLTLRESVAIIGGRSAQEHAQRLRQIVEEGEQARFANLEAQERRQQRRAEIASDPRAVEILWFVTSKQNTYETFYGNAYQDFSFFRKQLFAFEAATKFGRSKREIYILEQTESYWKQSNDAAQAAFGMSLHDLFRVFMLSAENQKNYTTSIERMRELARGGEGVSESDATSAARWLRDGRTLPEPTLP